MQILNQMELVCRGGQTTLKTANVMLQYPQTVLKTAVAGCENGF